MSESDEPGITEDDPGVASGENVPSHDLATPAIGGDEQHEGQTTQPAPDDDVGVPDDPGQAE